MSSPDVFVSYTHDSDRHCADVLEFATFLVSCGIEVLLDKWAGVQRQDWYPWARGGITSARHTVVIGSPGYRRMGDGQCPDNENYGGRVEAALLREFLQRDRDRWTRKILPVLLPGHPVADLPDFLVPYSNDRYEITSLTPTGAESLLRVITGQAEHIRPPLGPRLILPPKSGPGS